LFFALMSVNGEGQLPTTTAERLLWLLLPLLMIGAADGAFVRLTGTTPQAGSPARYVLGLAIASLAGAGWCSLAGLLSG